MNRDMGMRLCGIGAGVLGLMLAGGCEMSQSSCCATQPVADVLTAERQKALVPAEVIANLKAGNQRFVAEQGTNYDYQAQAKATADHQYPQAVVLSCLDSRVPPEVIFNQGIGDIFVARVAGNFENTDILGSMEYAAAVAGAKAIVVLGHSSCGAVKGTIDDAKLGNLTATLENIKPAVEAAKAKHPGGHYTSKDKQFLHTVTEENVRKTVADITQNSPVLSERVAKGELVIVGAVYDLKTGQIEWLD